MKTVTKHLRDFLIPILMTVILPLWLNRTEHRLFDRPLLTPATVQMVAGIVIGLSGLALMLISIVLMIRIARSTVMPWDPSKNLVIQGPYRYLRNPMILGVIILLFGEAVVLSSYGIAILAGVFFILNTAYFVFFEEPSLEERFGEAYRRYKANVPRWLPRLKPWHPEEDSYENRSR